MLNSVMRREDLAWLLGGLCQIHRIPWDAALALQQFAPPYSVKTLIEAAAQFGLRLGIVDARRLDWSRVTYPVIAFLAAPACAPGAAERTAKPEAVPGREQQEQEADAGQGLPVSGDEPAPLKPLLLAHADAGRILFFESGSKDPRTARIDELTGRSIDPTVLLVAREEGDEAESTGREDPAAPAPARPGRFGFAWFAHELLKHKRIWRDVLIASLALQIAGLATPLFTQVIIDKVVVHHTLSTLQLIAVGLVMFMLFNAGMGWLRQYLVLHTGNRVDAVLGSHVFRHLMRLPLPYFEHRSTGTLVARLHAVETIREFISGAAVSLLLDLPFLAVFLAVMFWYSWELTLIALAALLLITALSFLVTPVFRARLNRQFLLGARNQAFVTEYVSGIETVKALQMEPHLQGRFDNYLGSYLAAGFATRQLSNTYNVIANAMEQVMTLSILCAGALLVMQNTGFTIGMLVAFQMFASRMSQPMLRLASLWQEFQQASIAMRRLGDIMDVPAEPVTIQPSRAPNVAGRVEVEALSFRYREELPWLYRDLSLVLQPGKLTVLTGASGTGKSTLAKLLLGFYPPVEGRIAIDGRDIRHFSANELRQYFGVVPQETTLFSGTVYENLIAANPLSDFGEVAQACRIAEIHEVIERLPQGYNTLLGEHGVGLSGGQKQRLAIARAVLKRPRILVFDEATSSLDAPTAERFAQTVNRLKGQVTILFIAHQIPRGLLVDEVVPLGGAPGEDEAARTRAPNAGVRKVVAEN